MVRMFLFHHELSGSIPAVANFFFCFYFFISLCSFLARFLINKLVVNDLPYFFVNAYFSIFILARFLISKILVNERCSC